MRSLKTALAIIGLGISLAPDAALAQEYVPVNPESVGSYCYYGGTLYSVGARLCVPDTQGSFTLVCKSPIEDNDAAKTGRAVWRFDVGPPAPTCSGTSSAH
jgi:hypothetical protein